VFVSLALLLLALPIMALIASLIRRDGGPVFYRSSRLGRGGKLFFALKFRTMAPDADRVLRDLLDRDPNSRIEWEAGFKLRQDPRVTAIGRVLRKLSLDELPQLINVLMGDMSLVGPRPLLPAERAVYGETFNLYCQCLPGITGLWQVSGRNNLDYLRRIELNTWYAKNATLWIDIVILCRTLSVVIRRVGAV
jgi:lipopolysaccharide/colanic/teichoic acid biosynthesis glycosyltransferase